MIETVEELRESAQNGHELPEGLGQLRAVTSSPTGLVGIGTDWDSTTRLWTSGNGRSWTRA